MCPSVPSKQMTFSGLQFQTCGSHGVAVVERAPCGGSTHLPEAEAEGGNVGKAPGTPARHGARWPLSQLHSRLQGSFRCTLVLLQGSSGAHLSGTSGGGR